MKHWRVLLRVVDDGISDDGNKYITREQIVEALDRIGDLGVAGLTVFVLDAYTVEEEA